MLWPFSRALAQNQLSFKLLTIFNLKEYTQNETRGLIQVFYKR